MVGSFAQEIDAQEEVLQMEKKLAEAHHKLKEIRHAKAKRVGGGESGQSDTDGNMSGWVLI